MGRWAALAAFGVVFGFPLYWTITMAFKPEDEWQPYKGNIWWPRHFTLDNFTGVLGLRTQKPSPFFEPPIRSAVSAIENSLIAAGGGTLLALVVGILAAYGIARFGGGGRGLPLRMLQLRLVPPIVLVIPLFIVWVEFGLWGTLSGLAIIYAGVTLPFVVWLIRSFLQDLPEESTEAAIADGCTHWGAFIKVVLPQMKGAIAATALFVFVLNWGDLLIALFITNDSTQTAPVLLQSLTSDTFQREFGAQSALAVILAVPAVLLGVFAQRYLVQGLTFGAIRGRNSPRRR